AVRVHLHRVHRILRGRRRHALVADADYRRRGRVAHRVGWPVGGQRDQRPRSTAAVAAAGAGRRARPRRMGDRQPDSALSRGAAVSNADHTDALTSGYSIVDGLFDRAEVAGVLDALARAPIARTKAGARHALGIPAVRDLAYDARLLDLAAPARRCS